MPPTGPIVGIDLGTTNSLVGVAAYPDRPEFVEPRILQSDTGETILPSAVRFNDDGSLTIGTPARDDAVNFPTTTITSAKRLMGRSLDDARADLTSLPYDVVEGPNHTARIRLPLKRPDGSDVVVSPQEVSAHILAELKRRASSALAIDVTRAVVTVPAYFDDAQRQATRDAARLAGLDAVRIVNEPTAAALAYGLGLRHADRKPQTIAVYDLGGGTFDISILRLIPPDQDQTGADAFQVLATAGDTRLGGDDFDRALMDLFTREINQRFAEPGQTITFPPATRRALRQFAEATKIRLSEADSTNLRVDMGPGADATPRAYERTVTRDEFNALIAPDVDRTLAACRRALRDARRQLDEGETISAVVMVGGSTRVPLVRERVGEFFGLEPYTAIDPDRVVALGAAIQGAVLAGTSTDALLLDVVPLSLGIETVGGGVAKLIMRNAAVPARATERFSTSVDNQTAISINVLQGEREMAADCRSIGRFELGGIPPMPAGIPKLLVTFSVDANAVLSVHAVEERSGKQAAVQVIPNHGLTRDEIDRIERDSFAHARDDMSRHRVADLLVNARMHVRWTTRQLDKVESKLDPAYAADLRTTLATLEDFVTRATADWQSVNPDDFKKAMDTLDEHAMRLHEVSIAESLKEDDA